MDQAVEDYAQLKGPSLLKRTLGLQRRHHGLHIGHSGHIEPALARQKCGPNTSGLPQGASFRRVSDTDVFVLHPDQGTELYEDEVDDLDAIEDLVAPHGRALINLYFRIVHPSFPILHKKVYLEKYERTHREFSPVLLAAVYILATDYWSYSLELSGSAAPDVKSLESLAWKCLNCAIHRPKLSTVEAGLLLLQRSNQRSWPLTAQMVAVGQDLGLHRDCTSWDIPGWEKGLRKRLAWALFMQDKWCSLVQGRPSHISKADWRVQPLAEQDFPENFADENEEEGSTEVEKGRTLYTCMVSLTQILSDILVSLYSGTTEEDSVRQYPNETTQILMQAKPLQIRLKEWYAKLPQCLSTERIKLRKLSSSGYLHLAYWATETTLHRCIVLTLSTCSDPDLVKICQHAATARLESAMEFVRSLRPEHWESFWYFASEFNFGLIGLFETLLSATLVSEEDIAASMSRLDQYMWTLKMAKKNAGFLDRSISIIDLAIESSKQLKYQNMQIPNGHRDDPPDQGTGQRKTLPEPNTYPTQDYFNHQLPLQDQSISAIQLDSYQDLANYGFFDADLPVEQ